jgi:hypothetical protein
MDATQSDGSQLCNSERLLDGRGLMASGDVPGAMRRQGFSIS